MKRKQETCYCEARGYPHRKGELLCAELAEEAGERNQDVWAREDSRRDEALEKSAKE